MARGNKKTENKIIKSIIKHGLQEMKANPDKPIIEISIYKIIDDVQMSYHTIWAYTKRFKETDRVPFYKTGTNMVFFTEKFKKWIKKFKEKMEEKEADE